MKKPLERGSVFLEVHFMDGLIALERIIKQWTIRIMGIETGLGTFKMPYRITVLAAKDAGVVGADILADGASAGVPLVRVLPQVKVRTPDCLDQAGIDTP